MMPPPTNDKLTIHAEPTKQLFIAMLTRDVALIAAIIDLVDNCTDGARRLRGENSSWSGLSVNLETTGDRFHVKDNCGGIPVEVARQYAFRFGRPDEVRPVKGEVGRFGVGMKRGLFKLGRHFYINSTTNKSHFETTIDVDKWATDSAWQFRFDKVPIENGSFAAEEIGTTIVVTALHQEVKEHFAETTFIEDLRQQLTSKLEESIHKGLAVQVNGVTLKAHKRHFVSSPELAPAKKLFEVKGRTGGIVVVEVWCGLGKPTSKQTARAESGWYVFCNGRMLLEADKTTATGWGTEDDNEVIPAYHPQYNDFRGFVYMDAADAADLPWNTSKTALDTDHPVYRRVKQEMIAIARPVIDYFNKRKDENDTLKIAGEAPKGYLQRLLDEAPTKPLKDVSVRSAFYVPIPPKPKKAKGGPAKQTISFERDLNKATEVKGMLGVATWREVGEELFEYYYNAEVSNE